MNIVIKRTLLAISGLALIGTLAACNHRDHRPDPEAFAQRIMDRVTEKLNLNEEQVARLNGVKEALMTARQEMRKERTDKKSELLSLLDQPTLDQQKALALVNERGDAIKAQAPQVIAAVAAFYDSLTPEQQQTLRTEIQKRMERRDHCSWGSSDQHRKNLSMEHHRRHSSFQPARLDAPANPDGQVQLL
jgi:protein CpxP